MQKLLQNFELFYCLQLFKHNKYKEILLILFLFKTKTILITNFDRFSL